MSVKVQLLCRIAVTRALAAELVLRAKNARVTANIYSFLKEGINIYY